MSTYRHEKGTTVAMLTEAKEKRKKNLYQYLINNPKGSTIKEMAIDLNVSSDTVRMYLKEFMTEGMVAECGKEGKSVLYKASDISEPIATPKTEIVLPVSVDGRDFDVVKPALNVVQGDVVWVSSRSGGGQFFRYLVITPWARKATVVGVISEVSPNLDLNSCSFVAIGVDPETGEQLYADLSNVCSRGFKQFGEKLMTITDEALQEVKRVLARYYGIKCSDESSVDTKELEDQISKLKATATNMKAMVDKRNSEIMYLHEIVDKREAELQTVRSNENTYVQSVQSLNSKISDLEHALSNEQEKHKDCMADNDKIVKELNSSLDKLKVEKRELENELNEMKARELLVGDLDPEYTTKLENKLGELSIQNDILQVKLECQNEYLTTLKQLAFTAVKAAKGGD